MLPELPVIEGIETKWAGFYREPIRDALRPHGGIPLEGKGVFQYDRQ